MMLMMKRDERGPLLSAAAQSRLFHSDRSEEKGAAHLQWEAAEAAAPIAAYFSSHVATPTTTQTGSATDMCLEM